MAEVEAAGDGKKLERDAFDEDEERPTREYVWGSPDMSESFFHILADFTEKVMRYDVAELAPFAVMYFSGLSQFEVSEGSATDDGAKTPEMLAKYDTVFSKTVKEKKSEAVPAREKEKVDEERMDSMRKGLEDFVQEAIRFRDSGDTINFAQNYWEAVQDGSINQFLNARAKEMQMVHGRP